MGYTTLVVFTLLVAYVTADCGSPTFSAGKVIGGSAARHGSWPWQILLIINGQPGCGGSIISPNYIVTAAHCVIDQNSGRAFPAYSFTVRVGDNNRQYADVEERDYKVSQVFAHQLFSFRSFFNDVAVLRVSSPIRFGQYVKPVCMPSRPIPTGTTCYISGWGRDNRYYQQMSMQLNQAAMPVVDINTCKYYMSRVAPFVIGSNAVCSGYGGGRISGCQGDSGGPFVCQVNGKWELHGAVSWGSKQCSNNYNEYTVYANIHTLSPWIKSITGV